MVDGMYQAAGRVLTAISVRGSVVTAECERREQVESKASILTVTSIANTNPNTGQGWKISNFQVPKHRHQLLIVDTGKI